jgi:hypothetical protein
MVTLAKTSTTACILDNAINLQQPLKLGQIPPFVLLYPILRPHSRCPQLFNIPNLLNAGLAIQSGVDIPIPGLDEEVSSSTNVAEDGCLDDQRAALAVGVVGDLEPLSDLHEVVAAIAGNDVCGGVSYGGQIVGTS